VQTGGVHGHQGLRGGSGATLINYNAKEQHHMANEQSKSAKAELDQDVESLKEDLQQIKEDIALLADNLRGRASTKLREAKASAQAEYEEKLDSLEQCIQEKPLTTVLAAFGIGLLLGKIFSMK